VIQGAVTQLGLTDVEISVASAASGAIQGTHVEITFSPDQPSRDWQGIQQLLASSSLDAPVKAAALAVFGALAEAEAAAHDEPIERVHFHEVGAVDAIVDVVGACAGMASLDVEQIHALPVAAGSGWVNSSHGLLPVPAPATANLIARFGISLRPVPVTDAPPGELLTPTGAAILGALASWEPITFTPDRVGYGFGTRQLPWPNALRLWLGTATGAPARHGAPGDVLLETNIDDMNPQFFAPLTERLFAAGALDVWLTPIVMKKGRPGTIVSAIVPAHRQDEVTRTLMLESTTLGVRSSPIAMERAPRRFVTVTTRWGEVQLKLRGWEGRVNGAMPEYEDCLRLSQATDASIRDIWAEANRLGEVFIGQQWLTDAR
jgi:uncharacterized protein (TIGR00299 family) protein